MAYIILLMKNSHAFSLFANFVFCSCGVLLGLLVLWTIHKRLKQNANHLYRGPARTRSPLHFGFPAVVNVLSPTDCFVFCIIWRSVANSVFLLTSGVLLCITITMSLTGSLLLTLYCYRQSRLPSVPNTSNFHWFISLIQDPWAPESFI